MVNERKKHEYWNHFVANWATSPKSGPITTGPRLTKVKPVIWQDKDFWWDIIDRHSGADRTPEEMAAQEPELYAHCLGNFWSSVRMEIHRQNDFKL